MVVERTASSSACSADGVEQVLGPKEGTRRGWHDGGIDISRKVRHMLGSHKFGHRYARRKCGVRGEGHGVPPPPEDHFVDSLGLRILVAQSSNGFRKGDEKSGPQMAQSVFALYHAWVGLSCEHTSIINSSLVRVRVMPRTVTRTVTVLSHVGASVCAVV